MNQKAATAWGIVWAALSLVYGIFLLMYLNDNKKYASQMSKRDQNFRKAAVIITWVEIIATGAALIGLFISLFWGGGGGSEYPMMSSPMGFY
jgi:hypothetical protein